MLFLSLAWKEEVISLPSPISVRSSGLCTHYPRWPVSPSPRRTRPPLSQLTLSSFETSLGSLDSVISTLPVMTTCEAMKRGKYMNGKVELDRSCFVGSGKVL